MKLQSIAVQNYQGVRDFRTTLDRPILLVCADNGMGKSSLREAIKVAWLAEATRVKLKGEWGEMVTEGAKAAAIEIEAEGFSVAVGITAAGKVTDSLAGKDVPLGLAEIVTAQRMAEMNPDERRTFLLDLFGLALDGPTITARLLKRGCVQAKVDEIAPLLRAGIKAAADTAGKRVTEARGSWKGVTGETYGAVKAKTWRAPPGDWGTADATELAGLDAAVTKAEAELADAQQRLGAAQSEAKALKAYTEKLATLRETARTFAEHQDLVNRATKDLDELRARVMRETDDDSQGMAAKCPCCNELLRVVEVLRSDMSRVYELEKYQAKASKNPELAAAIELQEKVLKRHEGNRDAAELAAAEVKLMEENMPPAPAIAADVIAETVRSLTEDLDAKKARRQMLKISHETFDAADKRTKNARAHHQDVTEWSQIVDALAPDGIPSEILGAALKPFNARLAQNAADTDWMPVRIADDMTVTAGGRRYERLSDSEKWRTDAQIAEAVSHVCGLKLLILDRFDVLDMRGRSEALGWLDMLAEHKEIDSAIVLGTLVDVPRNLPPRFQAVRMEAGRLVETRIPEGVAA